MNHRLLIVLICGAAACSANPARYSTEPTEPAPQTTTPPPEKAPVEQVDMLHHWTDAVRLRDLVVGGDINAARAAADKLAAQPAPTDAPGWATYVQRIDGHVQAARTGDSLAAIATATANMAATCGECHAANQANVQMPTGLAPPEGMDARAHMARHGWAVHAMWEGLVGPSDGRWSDGVGRLAEKPLHETAEGSPFIGTPTAEQTGARVHDAAVRGAGVSDPTARAAVFAEIITACADCHSQTQTGPAN